MPDRHNPGGDYRYGFQGQEMDDEVKGEGNSINFRFRMHDPRIGRFFAIDPLTSKYPHYTPYSFSGNKIIVFRELEGLEEIHFKTYDKEKKAWIEENPDLIVINNNLTENVNCYMYQNSNGDVIKAVYHGHRSKDRKVSEGGLANNLLLESWYGLSDDKYDSPLPGVDDHTYYDPLDFGSDCAQDGNTTKKDWKIGLAVIATIATAGQGAGLLVATEVATGEILSVVADLVLASDGYLDYSDHFSPGVKKLFQTLNVIKGMGNIFYQTGNLANGGVIDIYETGGNLVGTVTVTDNVMQLSGSDGFLNMLDEAGFDVNELKSSSTEPNSSYEHTCFVAGTLVSLADGTTKIIENITPGEKILSVNTETMVVEEDEVLMIPNVVKKYRVIEAQFDNGVINKFSPAHPYWVVGKGWSVVDSEEAKKELNFTVNKMQVGDTVLYLKDGQLINCKLVKLEITEDWVEMYNVEFVKNNHSFFANGILVHNKFIDPIKDKGNNNILDEEK